MWLLVNKIANLKGEIKLDWNTAELELKIKTAAPAVCVLKGQMPLHCFSPSSPDELAALKDNLWVSV